MIALRSLRAPHLRLPAAASKAPACRRLARRPVRAMAAVSDADPTGSFISQFVLQGSKEGPLAGLTLAVKDLYDIAGHMTGFGNPTWRDSHPAASATAPPVSALLAAGATVVGKTHLDELAYSLNGENAHYGTPVNVAAPGRIPGGSSSGSAAAVAAGQADIGLGSDTGGSVRVPASYCGIFGIRPTHGRVSLQHACPLAASYDTCGWFARDAALLQRVGSVLLPPASAASTPLRRWLVARDAFALAQPATSSAIYNALAGERLSRVTAVLGQPTELELAGAALAAEGLERLEQWWDVFRITQAHEIWAAHGRWVSEAAPQFGPGVADRFKMASGISDEQAAAASAKRSRLRQHVLSLLGDDGLLALPSAPGPAPLLATPPAQLDDWRRAALSLTCIAGLGGLPQVSLPLASVDGLPVGLSLIGPRGSDEQLLELAVRLADAVTQLAAA